MLTSKILLTISKILLTANRITTATVPQLLLTVHEGHLKKSECEAPLAEVQLERHFVGPGVRRIEVEEGRVRGALYVPPGPGPHPAVIDMFGASTSIAEHRSGRSSIVQLDFNFFWG